MSRSRRIVIVRHGERVDHLFQDVWVENCFDNDGNYTRQNLNQPAELPRRKCFPQTFIRDSPLTEIGLLQATLRGQGIAASGILADGFEVFTSPSLRCIQTATNILKASGNTTAKISTEPSLFEWTQIQWYLNGNMPKWMTPEDLIDAGFNVEPNYSPIIPPNKLKEGESVEQYYDRSYQLILNLLNKTDKDLLLVGHGFTSEVVSRNLLGKPSRSMKEMLDVVRNVPYCGMVTLEQDSTSKKWAILPLPLQLQLKHTSAHDFDAHKAFY